MINIFFVSLILFFGAVTSYEDLRIGKVRNKWIVSGLFIASIAWLLFFVFNQVSLNYLGLLLLNFCCATIFSFLLWRFSSWAAGDAKMFILYSLMTPLYFYSDYYINIFPSFIIIFNTFLILLTCLFFQSIFFGLNRVKQKIKNQDNFLWSVKKRIPQGKIFFQSLVKFLPSFLLFMISVTLSYQYLINFYQFSFLLYQALAIALVIIFSRQIIILNQRPYAGLFNFCLFLVFLLLGLWWNYERTLLMTFNLFSVVLVFLICFPFLKKIITFYLDKQRGKMIEIKNLSAGMVLKAETIKILKIEENIENNLIGISQEEVDLVISQAQAQKIEKISIERPFYFAVWLFIGELVTLSIQGTILSYIL
jgi:hypothetical protein